MFRSKGFIIAFSSMSAVALMLAIVLGILLFGKGKDPLTTSILLNAATESEKPSEEAETGEPEETHFTIRALLSGEEHVYPVMDELIEEPGLLTIIKPGENDEGITFHAKPAFDEPNAEGNAVLMSGSFEVVGKIFVNSKSVAYPMYKTKEGYYVTSNHKYVGYRPDEAITKFDDAKKGIYGYEGTSGILLKIHADDGNHMSFSIYTFSGNTETPVLDNVIAKYNSFGLACFEFWNQSETAEGTILLRKDEENGLYTALVKFDSPIMIGGQMIPEFEVLQNAK